MQKIEAGEVDPVSDPIGVHNLYADYTSKAGARHFDSNLRTRRLAALHASFASGDTLQVDAAVKDYVEVKYLDVTLGSSQWSTLAHSVARAEIQALQQTLGRDRGDYSVQISDPIVKPPNTATSYQKAVPLKALFHDSTASLQMIGKHRDGGATWG